ncbi:hypothetical protein Hanom_Chr08g00708711 [Helianthus anomalus]
MSMIMWGSCMLNDDDLTFIGEFLCFILVLFQPLTFCLYDVVKWLLIMNVVYPLFNNSGDTLVPFR